MDINSIRSNLTSRLSSGFDLYERRQGSYQLIIPILHEDGDMVDIYISESPKGDDHVRLCDFGMSLMRLSYSFDINTDSRQRIFDSILTNNGVNFSEGNLFLDIPSNQVHEGVFQFAGCVQKVCNMSYWNRETVRSAFYGDLATYVSSELTKFDPVPEHSPIPDYPINVDWSLRHNGRQFFVFGVLGNNKALSVAVALLEFQKVPLRFISIVVHEDMDALGRREKTYLTKNADKQYSVLGDFQELVAGDIERMAGVAG